MACYAMGKLQLREMERFDFKEAPTLSDALALSLTAAARKAFERGLLHGYRAEEETLYTVRGRIRMEEQIRRRFGIPVPVEVRYDEFTDDILANRLVKAAVWRLGRGRMRIRSPEARDPTLTLHRYKVRISRGRAIPCADTRAPPCHQGLRSASGASVGP